MRHRPGEGQVLSGSSSGKCGAVRDCDRHLDRSLSVSGDSVFTSRRSRSRIEHYLRSVYPDPPLTGKPKWEVSIGGGDPFLSYACNASKALAAGAPGSQAPAITPNS